MKKKTSDNYKSLPNEFHRKERFKGGRIHRNKKKYYRPADKKSGLYKGA